MRDVREVEQAERMGRSRSRIFFMLAIVFFAGQSLYFASSPATRDSHARVGAWLILVVLILLLLATGGFLLKGRKVRDLLNDESSRHNRLAAQATGFWVTIITALVVYVESIFDPITFNQGIHIIVTLGVGAALISFAMRERRAHAVADALANRLRELRDEKGWTQAELAARVGVSRKTVNTIENRVFTPSATLAIKLAEAFGLSVEQLFWIER